MSNNDQEYESDSSIKTQFDDTEINEFREDTEIPRKRSKMGHFDNDILIVQPRKITIETKSETKQFFDQLVEEIFSGLEVGGHLIVIPMHICNNEVKDESKT